MKGAIDILKFFHHLRIAMEYAMSFTKDYPNSVFSKMLTKFSKEIAGMYDYTIKSYNVKKFAPDTIPLIEQKWNASNWDELAVVEKIGLMNDEQIEAIEKIIDSMLLGETVDPILN